jgi:hypothetical protein
MNYSEPTRELLGLGETQLPLPDYLGLGFTAAHVGELLRMATDPELLNAEENAPEFWAAVHAWYALGQLKAAEAIAPLLDLQDRYPFDRLFYEELPEAIAQMGAAALPALKNYLWDTGKDELTRSTALPCLEKIGLTHREACLAILTEFLQQADENGKELAGLAICSLIKLRAVESIEIIRDAFNRGCVDISIPGDLEDVEIALDLRDKRTTPRPIYHNPSPEMLEQIREIQELLTLQEEDLNDDIEPLPIRRPPKIGRNDPCPCGSGKKYKKCCLR